VAEEVKMEDVALIAVGNEPQSRTGKGLNCAAQLAAPNYGRECKRKASKGDYCLQHWLMNYGHSFNVSRLECPCGSKWGDADVPEICSAKVAFVELYKHQFEDQPQ
jgi:hypothetical protein